MAIRLAFYVKDGKVYSKEIEFQWMPGLSAAQKKRSIANMHHEIHGRSLEISTKSDEELGFKLSAFNLKLHKIPVENIFQSSKVFQKGGPYVDLLEVSARDAKRDERLKNSGRLIAFEYDGQRWNLYPKTAFYDYIYVNAVRESFSIDELMKLMEYDYFTDIEFNHKKSINTQARTVALIKQMLIDFGDIPKLTSSEFIKYHESKIKA